MHKMQSDEILFKGEIPSCWWNFSPNRVVSMGRRDRAYRYNSGAKQRPGKESINTSARYWDATHPVISSPILFWH